MIRISIVIIGLWCISFFASATLTFDNCGKSWTLAQRPQKIVALNQTAADILLALDVGSKLVGVSYIDDDPKVARDGEYRGIPILARRYPAVELLYRDGVDFVVAGFPSAFAALHGDRKTLGDNMVGSYLLSAACSRDAVPSLNNVVVDLQQLGEISGRSEKATALIAHIRQRQAEVAALPPLKNPPGVFYYDSGTAELRTQGQRGFVNTLLRDAGARNIFSDIAYSGISISLERLLQRDPDIILLADAVWSTAESKRRFLEEHPALSTLSAVKAKRYIIFPFSQLTPGVDSADSLLALAIILRTFGLSEP
ncbi:ABC transporter substrate-binding protein [Salmonella enterica]|nr:ABC transporter substrate-binding protein [Salmonella enterica subsp. enterica serovar Oslo]EMD1228049.1 ABC transporter substrate-binding protein [Salmonella enterica]